MLAGTRTLYVTSLIHLLFLDFTCFDFDLHGLLLNVVDRTPLWHLVQTGLTGVYSRPGVYQNMPQNTPRPLDASVYYGLPYTIWQAVL